MKATYYRDLIRATLRHALAAYAFTAPRTGTIAVAAALPAVADRLGLAMNGTAREAIAAHIAGASSEAIFVDGQGHTRPPYAPLALRAILRAAPGDPIFRPLLVPGERAGVRAGRHHTEIEAQNSPSSEADAVVRGAFAALLAGDSAAGRFFATLTSAQLPNGTFIPISARDNPEPRWYDELAVLHALSTFAGGRGDATLDAAVARSVAYHAAEVQPDHASAHPWAIAAFLDFPDGLPLADMMLHAAGVQQPAAMDAVSLLLLADAIA